MFSVEPFSLSVAVCVQSSIALSCRCHHFFTSITHVCHLGLVLRRSDWVNWAGNGLMVPRQQKEIIVALAVYKMTRSTILQVH